MNRIDEAVGELIAHAPPPPGIQDLRRRIRRRRYARGTAVLLLASASIACIAFLAATITSSTGPARVSVSSPTTGTLPRSTSTAASPPIRSQNPVEIGVEILGSGPHPDQILAVLPGSPAAAAGLAPGDTITAINHTKVASPSDINAILRHFHPGDAITITWSDTSRTTHTATVRLVPPRVSHVGSIPSGILRSPATTARRTP